MSIDKEFLRTFVGFLDEAFPTELSARDTVGRADIMVYALATKLSSLTGTKLDFLDWAHQGRHDGDAMTCHGERIFQGGSGGVGPHRRLEKLVSYAVDVSSCELSNAFLERPVVR